jgi:N-acyl-D-amino-acid deacylase
VGGLVLTGEPFDLLLTGGEVIDGSGAPRFRADVGIRGDRIAAVGDLSDAAAHARRDVAGLIVAPGFIDVHTHDDGALLWNPDMSFKVSQGVTTVVAGNCGISIAPWQGRRSPPRPHDLLAADEWFRFPRFADYVAALDADPPAVNAALLVGHTTLRAGAMGTPDRPATRDELGQMVAGAEEACAAGAFGVSSGLYYESARSAPTDEVIELAKVAARYGGLYATHLRDEGAAIVPALEEAFAIGRAAGVPVMLSHHKVAGRANHGRSVETLALIERALQGQDVSLDVYPYTAGSTELSMDRVADAERVLVTFSRSVPQASGRDLAELAAEWGVTAEQAVARLHPAGAIYFLMDEADVRRIMTWPGAMIGSDGLPADAHPHPRLWATFPRVLGRYSRELGLFGLEEAVRRMTSLPARRFGLAERGAVAAGAYADIVVFDAERVADRATYERPAVPAAGIELVLVNGQPVWERGAGTGVRSGRVLRRQQDGATDFTDYTD